MLMSVLLAGAWALTWPRSSSGVTGKPSVAMTRCMTGPVVATLA